MKHEVFRRRRDAGFIPRGRYRGQTQSQYLAIENGNGKDEGKAEAISAADTSKAIVSEYKMCPNGNNEILGRR